SLLSTLDELLASIVTRLEKNADNIKGADVMHSFPMIVATKKALEALEQRGLKRPGLKETINEKFKTYIQNFGLALDEKFLSGQVTASYLNPPNLVVLAGFNESLTGLNAGSEQE